MSSRQEQQMKKGVLEILVLKLLQSEQKYGYQLLTELSDKSQGMFSVKQGTLYPILYRLEDDGFVQSDWSQPKGKEVSRKYYTITTAGKQELDNLYQLWTSFSEKVSQIMEERNGSKNIH